MNGRSEDETRSSTLGDTLKRVEDRALVRGEACYTDDIRFAGMLHAAFARSPYPHAKLRGIDTAAAREMEAVVGVFLLDDYLADGCRPLPYLLPDPVNQSGDKPFFPERWPLAGERVRFVGDPFAMVVARSAEAARDAAEAIETDAETLPAVTRMRDPDGPGEPIWPERPDNACFLHEIGNPVAVRAAFEKAAHVVSGTFIIPRVAVSPLEPRGCVARYDASTDMLTVHAGVQDIYGCRTGLAAALRRDPDRIAVVSPNVGGSFGMKHLDPETLLVSWAALRLKHPVKWISSRSEAFLSDNHGRDNISTGKLAVSEDGMFLGLKVETDANIGAYAASLASGSPTNNLGSLAGVYRTPAIFVRVRGVFTNTNPTGPYRGAGRPEASFVIERLVDLAARRTGLDRAEIRRRNMIAPEEMPFTTGLGHVYDCGEFETVMNKTLSAADWDGFQSRRKASAENGKLRGIGISTVIERATLSNTFENVRIQVTPTGTLRVFAGSSDQGQGHATMYTQLAAAQLGVRAESIEVTEADTRSLGTGGMTGSSRVSAMGSAALLAAIRDLVEKGVEIAASELEAAAADIVFASGRFTVAGTDRGVHLAQVAEFVARHGGGAPSFLEGNGNHVAERENFPNGCHACEVEIEPATGRLKLCAYVVVDDLGNVINKPIVEGQLHGAIAQGIGEALLEAVTYDEDGQLLSGSFMDYALPRASDICGFVTRTHPVPTSTNPLGVKGAGEAGLVGALPAIVGAVVDALSEHGVEHVDMPITSEKIWFLINACKTGR